MDSITGAPLALKDSFCTLLVRFMNRQKVKQMTEKVTPSEPNQASTLETDPAQKSSSPQEGHPITGRGVFVVQIVSGGVAVRSGMLVDGDKLIEMPAIFPDVHYAMAQIDELKNLVARHFAEAAQLGAQMIAAQAQMHSPSGAVAKDQSTQVDAPSVAVNA
ncbi:hypothetical protein B9Z31_01170 [Limnohabitans sp. G3-2]|nr:hypothetical protein B9Z31_01170 [Limnohabitans sp. G3-2]